MPAVAMTNVMPIASTPTTLAWVSMLRTLSQVGKVSGFRIDPDDEQEDDDGCEPVFLDPERLQTAGERGASTRARRLGSSGHTTSSARSGASVGATAWRRSSCSVASVPVDLGDDLAVAHDEDARADADELLELRRDDEHAEPGRREVADDPVDLGLRRDVDAARRLVEQQHAAFVEQPAREHDLLLVSARQQANDAVGIVGHGVQRPELLARAGALLPHVEQHAREATEVRDRHVLRLAPVEDESLRLAVLGSEPEPPR